MTVGTYVWQPPYMVVKMNFELSKDYIFKIIMVLQSQSQDIITVKVP